MKENSILKVLVISDMDTKYGAYKALCTMVSEMKANYPELLEISVLFPNKFENGVDKCSLSDRISIYKSFYSAFNRVRSDSIFKSIVKYGLFWLPYIYTRIIGVRVIENKININQFDIIHTNSSRIDIGAILARKYKKKHIWHLREFYNLDYRCFSYRKNFIRLMNESDLLIAVSNSVREHWISKGINPEKILTIYDGIPSFEMIKHKISSVLRYVIIGSINAAKGQDILIDAVIKIPKDMRNIIHIDIIGDGKKSYIKKLKEKIYKNNIESCFTFRGYITDPKIEFNKYDVGLMCSRSEGFGLVTIEYMMAGIPVIGANTGATVEIIRDGIDGKIFDRNNCSSLTEAMLFFVKNKDMISVMGENAKRRALEFTSNKNATSIFNVYQSTRKCYECD